MEAVLAKLRHQLEAKDDELEALQEKLDAITDARFQDADLAAEGFEKKKAELEEQFALDRENLENDCQDRIATMEAEVEALRAAAKGDSGGWEEMVDDDGNVYYQNMITGETSWDKPESLEMTEQVIQQENTSTLRSELERVKKRALRAEEDKRRLQGKDQGRIAEMTELRKAKRSWEKNAAAIKISCQEFQTEMDSILTRLQEKAVDRLDTMNTSGEASINKLRKFQSSKLLPMASELKFARGEMIRALATEEASTAAINKAKEELLEVQENIAEESEKIVAPMRDAMRRAEERAKGVEAKREADREHLAILWPELDAEGGGVPYPSILLAYRPLDDREKDEKMKKLAAIEEYRRMRRTILDTLERQKQWTQVEDDFGTPFYHNTVTGEASWELPDDMAFEVPDGWDEEGRRLPEGVSEEVLKAEEQARQRAIQDFGGWILDSDEDGYDLYINLLSGAKSWTKPKRLQELEQAEAQRMEAQEQQRAEEEERARQRQQQQQQGGGG